MPTAMPTNEPATCRVVSDRPIRAVYFGAAPDTGNLGVNALSESVVAQLAPTGTLNLVGSSARGVGVEVVGPAREVLASFEDGSIIDASCGASTCVEGE